MKKIAMLLALVMCMTAATAMAEPTLVKGKYGDYPAEESGYYVKLQSLEGHINDDIDLHSVIPDDVAPRMIESIKGLLGTDDFKVMYYDAEAYDSNDENIGIGNKYEKKQLNVVFDSDFFDGDTIEKIVAVRHSFGRDVYPYSVENNKTSAEITFDHLTPIAIAWIPAAEPPVVVPPVAAPLLPPAAADMPSTGDSSSLPGMFILLGMSMAAFAAMKLRRRED